MYVAPLLLGLAGSLHCVGMCGPLIMALPLDAESRWKVFQQMSWYHAGRILTYVVLGILFGLLGKGLALAGAQKILSIAGGLLMLFVAFASWRFERLIVALPGFGGWTQRVKSGMARLLRRSSSNSGSVLMGMLNGLLPCGMVYAALAGAVSTTEGYSGALFMLLFGLGTLPLLFGVSFLGRSFGTVIRQKIRFAQPVLLTLAGLLLLQRGLHLDLSLFESAVPKAGYDCH